MATYAAYLRDTGVDGTSIVCNPNKTISAYGKMQPTGSIWYVEGNVRSSGDGKTWATAFKTLAEGLAAADAWQRLSANRAWAGRSTVFVKGDDLDEDLTTLAEKTDVVGVGSDDGNKGPRILGNHTICAVGSGNYMGCRFFDVTFKPEAAGVTFDIPTGQHGIEFHRCKWEWDAASVIGLRLTAALDTVVDNCRFVKGFGTGFSTAAIYIAAGAANQTVITNNYIDANVGIYVHASTTGEGILIANNTVIAVGLTIDENSNLAYVIDNRCISEGAQAEDTTWDMNEAKAAGNLITASDTTIDVPNMA